MRLITAIIKNYERDNKYKSKIFQECNETEKSPKNKTLVSN
jgi:hypothetical protein